MKWEKVEDVTIDPSKHYAVLTNGYEWRDPCSKFMSGDKVIFFLDERFVRGRPVLVCELPTIEDENVRAFA